MEFYENKFQPIRNERSNGETFESKVGFVHILNYEIYDCSLFLSCFNPDRFILSKVYFYFQGFEVQSFYHLCYKDTIVTFNLYFYSVDLLFDFFRNYEDDYNLNCVLSIIFHGRIFSVTRNECLDILFTNAIRESSDVLEVGAGSEQQGLLSDELPF